MDGGRGKVLMVGVNGWKGHSGAAIVTTLLCPHDKGNQESLRISLMVLRCASVGVFDCFEAVDDAIRLYSRTFTLHSVQDK